MSVIYKTRLTEKHNGFQNHSIHKYHQYLYNLSLFYKVFLFAYHATSYNEDYVKKFLS